MDQLTGGKWLIHGTKCRKDNHLQSLEPLAEHPSWEYEFDIKESDDDKFNTIV